MTHTYLLEIGLEEIPARFLASLKEQLQERVQAFLKDHRLSYEKTHAYATPRRLAVLVEGLAEEQETIEKIVRGPALKIAQDEDGEWTKAAQGFVRGQGASVEDIIIDQQKGENYIFINQAIEGLKTEAILKDIDQVLKEMTFAVSMTWGTHKTPFIRPIHWIVSLLDDKVIPFSFIEVQAGRKTQGHRFLGKEIELEHASTYVDRLQEQYVMADMDARQQLISEQITEIADENNWNIQVDPELLEEVTAIVEWPTAFFGSFDEKYLEIPELILTTAMRDHQRYFHVLEPETNRLLPYFVAVRNGNDYKIENVINGNQKVLVARLEDALFFYTEDRQRVMEFFLEKLEHVNEHHKLGSLEDKQDRVGLILKKLSYILDISSRNLHDVLRAAAIYKFDLMSAIVNEFSELQGQMGAIYAKELGESEQVAEAIGSQYLPLSRGGELPPSETAALLAVADKLDTLINYFNIGLIPSGSADPFALRRQANGIVEIIADQGWDLNLEEAIRELLATIQIEDDPYDDLIKFIKARIEIILRSQDIEHDIIQAVLAAKHLNILTTMKSAQALHALRQNKADEYGKMIESLTRVVNLGDTSLEGDIDESLIQTPSEQALVEAIHNLSQEEEPAVALEAAQALSPLIEDFFNHNMVNDPDEVIKANRLAMMKQVTAFVLNYMDPRELLSKF